MNWEWVNFGDYWRGYTNDFTVRRYSTFFKVWFRDASVVSIKVAGKFSLKQIEEALK